MALRLNLFFPTTKKKDHLSTATPHYPTVDWAHLRTNPVAHAKFQTLAADLYHQELRKDPNQALSISFARLSEITMAAVKKASPLDRRNRPDWFRQAATVLVPLIEHRNAAFLAAVSTPANPTLRDHLHATPRDLRFAVRHAKQAWLEGVAANLHTAAFRHQPKHAWEAVTRFMAGYNGHHRATLSHAFCKADGTCAGTDQENLAILASHFTKVFNRTDVTFDPTILDLIPQCPLIHDLDDPITSDEFQEAIDQLANYKAPGSTGVTAEALKCLPPILHHAFLSVVQGAWNGDAFAPEWHQAILRCLPKKGDLTLPNNWRGICLQDMVTRVLSSIITRRLHKVLRLHGTATQFGSQPGRGCIDGLFCVRSLLQIRRYHNQATWCLFLDLVKAYDTIQHKLLFAILGKLGVPPNLRRVIAALYTNVMLQISLGKHRKTIPYGVGVKH